jgi:hypothetical protein
MTRLRRALVALAAAAFAVAVPGAAALELRFDTAALDAAEAARARSVVGDVVSRLPATWRSALVEPVTIEWRDDLPPEVHGRARGSHVLLRRDLLGAPPVRGIDPLAGALVHELAHVLDRGIRGDLSRDPRLLDLAGWQAKPMRGRATRSTLTDRSPDPYELSHPREFLAVNLEHYVLDPEYACRRPALARHFRERLGDVPGAMECTSTHAFVETDATTTARVDPLLEIDPARVAGIDVLLAEPGEAAMSRWGHVMLRVVGCAPGRVPGPACRHDLAHHRVLSFRAFVDDVQISSWRGLTGSYPSRLLVLPLSQVVDEYTAIELRGLRSLPLDLTRTEIGSLLEHAAQLHWSHDGRYYFISNNCAVETWRMLRDGVPRLAGAPLASLTPTGLLARLERAGIADASVLGDREAAIRAGHYFPARSTYYATLFDAAGGSLVLPADDVQGWLALPPQRRTPWIARADLRAAAAMLVLEGAALRREEARARDELKRRLLQHAATGPAAAAIEALRAADRLTRPAALLPHGYGVPHGQERDALRAQASELAMRWREASDRLRSEAWRALDPRRRDALAASERNMAALGERLRALNHAADGLDLGSAID